MADGSLSSLQYGYSVEGIETYLGQIKSECLEEAKNQIMDYSGIKTTCETEWQGKARENFVENLEKDAKHVAEQLDNLYNGLEAEIKSLSAAMQNKDENLIEVK